jgi:hypothetical protein
MSDLGDLPAHLDSDFEDDSVQQPPRASTRSAGPEAKDQDIGGPRVQDFRVRPEPIRRQEDPRMLLLRDTEQVEPLQLNPNLPLIAVAHEPKDVSLPESRLMSFNAPITFIQDGKSSSRLCFKAAIGYGQVTDKGRYGNNFVSLAIPKRVADKIYDAVSELAPLQDKAHGKERGNFCFYPVNVTGGTASNYGVMSGGQLKGMAIGSMLHIAKKGLGGLCEVTVRLKCQSDTVVEEVMGTRWNLGFDVCAFAVNRLIKGLIAPQGQAPSRSFLQLASMEEVSPEVSMAFGRGGHSRAPTH